MVIVPDSFALFKDMLLSAYVDVSQPLTEYCMVSFKDKELSK